jgi:hypothetical protein
LTVALLALAGIATGTAPASAAEPLPATPLAASLKATTEAVVPASPQATVEQAVTPVRAAVDTLRGPVERAAAPVQPAVAAVVDRSSALQRAVSAPGRAPVRDTVDRRGGGVDRHASTRRGGDQGGSGSSLAADALGAATTPFQVGVAAIAEQARASASSTVGDGDDPLDGLPLGPGDGTSLLAGPAGIALLALGLLVAMLTVIPRFCSSFLPTPPARWGLVALRLPIERPD